MITDEVSEFRKDRNPSLVRMNKNKFRPEKHYSKHMKHQNQ